MFVAVSVCITNEEMLKTGDVIMETIIVGSKCIIERLMDYSYLLCLKMRKCYKSTTKDPGSYSSLRKIHIKKILGKDYNRYQTIDECEIYKSLTKYRSYNEAATALINKVPGKQLMIFYKK